ncbi:MAG TPA: transposase, partial [Rectinemataceae bacterium]|nr:transposase [Rectinemataceae bacterium]
ALRRQESRPILESIKDLIVAKRSALLPQSGLGMAISYTLDQWESLIRYVDVAEAEIDNNGAERSLRPVVIGRKNWLFIGHPNAGPRAATIMSLIETCRRLGIEPYEYLKDVLTELPKDPSRASTLTPRAWLATHATNGAEKASDGPAQ